MDTSQTFEKTEKRQRKKKVINEVKSLLEFYFSPANLKKDAFMNKLLEKDNFIELTIFHKFNKIKQLTDQTKILQKAIKNSEILELSEDGFKVKRKAPIVMKENDAECTIYVENLPPNTTHEWLSKVFSIYGVLDYISLPKFPNSGLPKGFAFIEFQTEGQAQQALYAFGGLASLDGTLNPNELRSVQTFNKDAADCEGNEPKYSPDAEVYVPNPINKTEETADDEDQETAAATSEEAPAEQGKEEKKKKKRKRNKKEKEYELDSIYLRVMSKKDWKTLRNQYLDAQKQNMRQLKQSFYSRDLGEHYSQQIHQQKKRKFTEYQEDNAPSGGPQFIPNVIVKLILSAELQDANEFRLGLVANRPGIAYVDLKAGETEIHIRFKTAEDAQKFLDEGLFENMELLKGDIESCYWSRILTLWELNKMKKKKKKSEAPFVPDMKRGRDKVVNRAINRGNYSRQNQHLSFD